MVVVVVIRSGSISSSSSSGGSSSLVVVADIVDAEAVVVEVVVKMQVLECTCDDSSVLSATGNVHRQVVPQPEFTWHVAR